MTERAVPLTQFRKGDRIQVIRMDVAGVLRRRLLDLGFVPGNVVEVLQPSPLGDPVAYRVNQTVIALRREEGSMIHGIAIRGDV